MFFLDTFLTTCPNLYNYKGSDKTVQTDPGRLDLDQRQVEVAGVQQADVAKQLVDSGMGLSSRGNDIFRCYFYIPREKNYKLCVYVSMYKWI